ncbi:MAG: glycosyltransferase [Sphingobacteriaceae bacterium]
MIIFLYYIIFFFLILRFTVTLFNYISNPKLGHSPRQNHDLVSILVPVRDEVDNILNLLQSIKDQGYQHYEVIILDDASVDGTYEICKTWIGADNRFSVVNGKDLPIGWLGKNFACYQLAALAKGRYLLFLDADETIGTDLINSVVYRMKVRQLKLLSLFTNQVMLTFGERLVVPLMHFTLLNLLPLRLVYLSKNAAFAAASGQCMVFDAADYHTNQWHEQVKSVVVEDIEIMKLVKKYNQNGEALLANGMVSCRMYKSYTEALNGFSKNLLAGFNYSVPGLLVFLMLLLGGPLFVMLSGDSQLILFMITLILLSRVMISFASGQHVFYNLILHPVQMISFALIAHLSIKRYLTKTTIWKGRKV